MPIRQGGSFLLTGSGVSGVVPLPMDNRASGPEGYLYVSAGGASAIVQIVASHDLTAWLPVMTLTAVTGGLGASALLSAAFYPYLGARATHVFSGAGGSAQPLVHYTPRQS